MASKTARDATAGEEVSMSLLGKKDPANGHDTGNGNGNGKNDATDPKATPADYDCDDMQSEILLNAAHPKAPDGGWGWVVVLGAFFCNFIVDGIMFSFDIMRNTFADEFPDVQPYEIQIMGSLIPGLYLSLAPIASGLLNRYGPRPLVMTGGVLGMLAFLASAFVQSFYALMFLYGVVGGVAFTLIYSPSILAVGFYFDKKRATATGITVCGSCFGTFALSSLMLTMFEYYGSWRGVLIICAGVVFNCCAFGALFRPLPELVVEQLVVTEEDQCVEDGKNGDDMQHQQFIIQKIIEEKRRQRAISRGSLDNCVITKDNRIVKIDANSQMSLSKTAQSVANSHRISGGSRSQDVADHSLGLVGASPGNFAVPDVSYDGVPRAPSQTRVHSYLHVSRKSLHQSSASVRSNRVTVQQMALGSGIMYRQDAYFAGNVQNTRQYRDAQAVAAAMGHDDADGVYARSVTYIPADGGMSSEQGDEPEDSSCCFNLIKTKSIRDVLLTTFDCTLLSSPTFLILCFAAFLGMLGFFTPFFFGSSYGLANGLDKYESLWVINSIAISNAVGRVLCGVLSDQPWADSLQMTNIAMIVSGALNIALPLLAHYGKVVFYVYAVAFGLAISPFISLRSIIVVDLLGLEKLTSAYGFLLLFMGIAAFVGSPILVGIRTATSFDHVFFISGAVLALSGIICLPCRALAKWEKDRAERKLQARSVEEDGDKTPANTPAELVDGNNNNQSHA